MFATMHIKTEKPVCAAYLALWKLESIFHCYYPGDRDVMALSLIMFEIPDAIRQNVLMKLLDLAATAPQNFRNWLHDHVTEYILFDQELLRNQATSDPVPLD